MYVRSITLGVLIAVAFNPPEPSAADYALQSTGAVQLRAAGKEARYGVVSPVDGSPILTISLGATSSDGAVQLILPGNQVPTPGRYSISGDSFQASFMAGTAEHPLGWFHGESGWVTITQASEGHLSGVFEMRARGFLAADIVDENQQVTVRGSFDATRDKTATRMALGR
jgi:hypothetical protein